MRSRWRRKRDRDGTSSASATTTTLITAHLTQNHDHERPRHCWCVFLCSFFETSNICLYYINYHHLSTQRGWKWLETCVNGRTSLFFSFTVLTRIYNEIHYDHMNVQQPHHQHLSKHHNQYSWTWRVATNTTFTLRQVATLPCHLQCITSRRWKGLETSRGLVCFFSLSLFYCTNIYIDTCMFNANHLDTSPHCL